ncbi:MAG: hypothetical protein JWP10_1578 [Nocardioidaceae bacterium]|nr:hypothetical protein [Nocardioidaceae bacterium]
MQSKNPVFARSDEFNGKGVSTYQSDPSSWQIDLNGNGPGSPTSVASDRRMTIDSVVEKTAITILTVTLFAAATWFVIGDVGSSTVAGDDGALAKAWSFAMGGAIIGLVLSLVNSFKKIISPALVLAYAAVEGVFVGAFSKIVSSYVGDPTIVFQAVLGTVIAFGSTLFVYKFFNIQVTDKFRKVVTAAILGFVAVSLVNWILSLTGVLDNGGLRGFNTLGLVVSLFAVGLAVFMLILDFDYVEKGVAAGLPERESWRAAFGLTVTLIWLYIEILRILAILKGD